MRGVSLASGSGGNAYIVEAAGALLLIDCGISCREMVKRCNASGFDPGAISAVLFTHDHGDHCRGAATFHKRFPKAELVANMMTAEAIAVEQGLDEGDFYPFENGQSFDIGPFSVRPFSTPHDARDSVGYLVTAGGKTYFHGTDIGTPLDSVGLKLKEADVAVLESNHDSVLLLGSERPEMLKQRIRGPRGHLSNDDAASLVRRFVSPRLKRLFLAHLSEECNAPHIAERVMRETLAELGRADIALEILSQHTPGTIWEC